MRPGLEVYLSGLNPTSVKMYMQIELPEDPLAEVAETFATIGTFYDAIAAAFTALDPPITNTATQVKAPGVNLAKLATLEQVHAAITTIKEQGEGTTTSPFEEGELAHYYRFGEISHGKKLIQVDGAWEFEGEDIPFPQCFPVTKVPAGGYPDATPAAVAQLFQQFNATYAQLIVNLQKAWTPGGSLGPAVGDMFSLGGVAVQIVTHPLPDGGGHYGPDFVVPSS